MNSRGQISDSEPVADHGLNHKSVLKVTNAVAPLCLAPLDTCNREEDAFTNPLTGGVVLQ